jgi:hypothetical protein
VAACAERLIGTLRRDCLDKCDADTFIVGQGCSARGLAKRDYCRYAHSVRAASSLRADMIFGSDSSKGARAPKSVSAACKPLGSLAEWRTRAHAAGNAIQTRQPETGKFTDEIFVGTAFLAPQSAVNSTACKHRGAPLSLRQIGFCSLQAIEFAREVAQKGACHAIQTSGDLKKLTDDFVGEFGCKPLNSRPIARHKSSAGPRNGL